MKKCLILLFMLTTLMAFFAPVNVLATDSKKTTKSETQVADPTAAYDQQQKENKSEIK